LCKNIFFENNGGKNRHFKNKDKMVFFLLGGLFPGFYGKLMTANFLGEE